MLSASKEARREVLEIPQSGTKHSLNVSVCGGMVLWEAYKAFGV
jgi:tRNA G18 (ribose-2'-O)-methylase SpoU